MPEGTPVSQSKRRAGAGSTAAAPETDDAARGFAGPDGQVGFGTEPAFTSWA